ncbi:MAG: SDR family oxidoreductase [Alphaproteobacteria bacterium]|nr:SDR family oxidoreductase [Alphaproteobacteria bacterium]
MSGRLFDIGGKTACVTGASSGIGQALATALAAAGASVVGVARRADRLDAWVRDVEQKGGRAAGIAADLADPETAATVAGQVAAPFGAPDILINAAGVNLREPAEVVTAESWRQTVDINLSTPFFLSQALVPAMQKRGWGRIINIASLQSERAFANSIAYGASKGGVAQLTRAMAEAWSKDGICCNALTPGFFPTELTAPVFDDPTIADRNAQQTCIGRNGRLDDLVGPLLFFASPASDYVTGQILAIDGGFSAK